MGRKGQSRRTAEQQSLLGAESLLAPPHTRGGGQPLHLAPRWKVGFAEALALVVQHGKKAQERAEMPPRTRCPRCLRLGDTLRDFGVRMVRGRKLPQSWCRTCRSAHAARRAPSQPDLLKSGAA
jgi:hypothetical protein